MKTPFAQVVPFPSWQRIFVLLMMFSIPMSWATTVVPPTFEELVENSEVIFQGEVTEIESKWVGENETRRIETHYSFQISEVLKGNAPATYLLKVMGGTVADTTLKVEGAPHFAQGDKVILFVTGNGTQFIPLVGIMYGHYRLVREPASGSEVVVKFDGQALQSIEEIGRQSADSSGGVFKRKNPATPSAQTDSSAPMTSLLFKDQIRAKKNELEH